MAGFNSDELERPPSRHEQRQRIKAWKALELWAEPGATEASVAKAMGVTKESARVLINRGVALYEERKTEIIALKRFQQERHMDIIRDGWIGTAGTDRTSAEMVVKAWERSSKHLGLDAQKDAGTDAPLVVVVNPPAEFGWRAPRGRRAETVEGEIVQEALEGGSPSTDPSQETPENAA